MNELQVFTHSEFGSVRTVELDGEMWFVGRDVAEALGYSNPRDAIGKHVISTDKGVAKCDTLGGRQNFLVINESGLYSLILSSKLPSAQRFKHWVTSEVLPAIRRHGMYAIEDLLDNPDLAIAALTRLKEERERVKVLQDTVAVQTQQITEMQPKASYYDVVLNCKDLMSISAIAKDYGRSAKWLNGYLHEKGVQFRQGDIWLLYQQHARMGYTSTKTHSFTGSDGSVHCRPHTYWTQKGRLFIYDLLKADGILPIIEV